MGINSYFFKNIKAEISNEGYWDLTLSSDETDCNFETLYTDNIISGQTYFDFSNTSSFDTPYSGVCSLTSWDTQSLSGCSEGFTGSITSGFTICDIGLCGVDNGFVPNLSGETLTFVSGDTQLCLTRVTGSTYTYPMSAITGTAVGTYMDFCGGFFQGFWALDGYPFKLLPKRYNYGWTVEAFVKLSGDCSAYPATTLNDTYPNNKGLFFFMGTRAENKWCDNFSGVTGLSTCTGIPLSATSICSVWEEPTQNPFICYGKCGGGIDISCSDDCTEAMSGDCRPAYCAEYITCNHPADLQDNAFALRITDDGRLGYRAATFSGACQTDTTTGATSGQSIYVTGVTFNEYYATGTTVSANTWTHVAVSYIPYNVLQHDCVDTIYPDPDRDGRLVFYVNGRRAGIQENVREQVFRALRENKDKQEGVPFNMSVGGGTQGLAESRTFNGPDPGVADLAMERNFGGSFVGGISKLRFHIEALDTVQIRHNFELQRTIYGIPSFNKNSC
tara:strand:- start:1910 stop:3418 length:1509 start_codon:yes stop_codon:yes gene_type:complete